MRTADTLSKLPLNYIQSSTVFKNGLGIIQSSDTTIQVIEVENNVISNEIRVDKPMKLHPLITDKTVITFHNGLLGFHDPNSSQSEYEILDGTPIAADIHSGTLIVWSNQKGIKAIDLISRKEIWHHDNSSRKGTANLLFYDGCLIFEARRSIVNINIADGTQSILNDDGCTGNASAMRIVGNHLIRYNECLEEGDHFPKLIELLDLKTGKVTHRGWTSASFIEENSDDENGLNTMDESGIIRFSYGVSKNNLLLGQTRDYIYAFRVR